jgi:hypothetical protein
MATDIAGRDIGHVTGDVGSRDMVHAPAQELELELGSTVARAGEAAASILQLALVLARVALWLGAFAALVFGLFTFPILMLGGFLFVYLLWHNVRFPQG